MTKYIIPEQQSQKPFYLQDVPPNVPHPLNYHKYFVDILSGMRSSLPITERGGTKFGKRLSEITGQPPYHRNTISNFENYSLSTNWGVVSGYLTHFGLWPELIDAIQASEEPTIRYIRLIKKQLQAASTEKSKRHIEYLLARAKRYEQGQK